MAQMDNANATLFFLDREGLDHDQCCKPDVQENYSGDVGKLVMSGPRSSANLLRFSSLIYALRKHCPQQENMLLIPLRKLEPSDVY